MTFDHNVWSHLAEIWFFISLMVTSVPNYFSEFQCDIRVQKNKMFDVWPLFWPLVSKYDYTFYGINMMCSRDTLSLQCCHLSRKLIVLSIFSQLSKSSYKHQFKQIWHLTSIYTKPFKLSKFLCATHHAIKVYNYTYSY